MIAQTLQAKIGEAMSKAGGDTQGTDTAGTTEGEKKPDENVTDVDYEEKKEEGDKSDKEGNDTTEK